jgi:16S rRNA (adenine1518-N6/adenine1519-N6)-dimethyltransferase
MPRRLGQHFLKYPEIAARMAALAEVNNDETVLEIGPGHGALTEFLAKRAKHVIAIEKDKALVSELEGKWPNVELISGDAVKMDWPHFDKLASNLPYEISSPVLEKLFDSKGWKIAALMLQKEFAKRLVAKPGTKDWSRLTVLASYHSDVELVATVGPGAFKPPPKVDSAIVLIRPKKPPFATDDYFWETVNRLFQQKKKTVRAAIKAAHLYDHKHGNAIALTLPEEFEKKRVVQCDLEDIKQIVNILREHMH